jgi:hypothetical protein
MMVLEALLEIQLILLYPLVDGMYLLLYRSDGLFHGTHASLNSSQGLHNLWKIELWLWRRDCLRGWSHIWKTDWHGSRNGYLIIGVISPQLCIRLHQSLLADGLLNLHLRFSSYVDGGLKDDLSEQAAKRKTGITLIKGLQHDAHNMLAQAEMPADVDGINQFSLLQNQVTAPDNWP